MFVSFVSPPGAILLYHELAHESVILHAFKFPHSAVLLSLDNLCKGNLVTGSSAGALGAFCCPGLLHLKVASDCEESLKYLSRIRSRRSLRA